MAVEADGIEAFQSQVALVCRYQVFKADSSQVELDKSNLNSLVSAVVNSALSAVGMPVDGNRY